MQDANQTQFQLDVTSIELPLQVYEFTGEEILGENYWFDITFVCDGPELPLAQWLQLPARLTIHYFNKEDPENTKRYINGVIESMEKLNSSFRVSTYQLRLVPIFSLLKYRKNIQIFQQKNVPEIISEMYQQAGILSHHFNIELYKSHQARDYCVQYGESDEKFIMRLMAEEGLVAYFEHKDTGSTLIISDGQETYTALVPLSVVVDNGMVKEGNVINSLSVKNQVQVGKVSVKEYLFTHPKQYQEYQKEEVQRAESALEHYQYPVTHSKVLYTEQQATLNLEQRRIAAITLEGSSDSAQLTAGHFQPINQAPNSEWDTDWLVITVSHAGRQPQVMEELAEGGLSYHANFTATPWFIPYKLAEVGKPYIRNIDTAIVTGPENEEIYCDEYGRVKVQFHWDRNGQADEKTSCWLRTLQGWAGNQYGQFVLPRIGHEVIVSFIHGDPDKPIITGSLYNGDNKPPYTLPEHKTRSTFKTSSSIGADNFNELRFDDKNASEQIYIHAAKDMDSQIQNNRTSEIFNDDHSVVHHDQFHQITKDNHLTVQSDNLSSIKGDAHLQVSGSIQQKSQGSRLEQIGTELHIKVGNKAVLDAGSELTITTGSSTMKLDSGGIHLLGAAIDLNKGGSAGSGSGYAGITATQPIMKQSETAGSTAETAVISEYTRSKIHATRQVEALKTLDPICEECEQEQEQE